LLFPPGGGSCTLMGVDAMQYDDLWFAISIAWVLVLLGATIMVMFA